VGKSALLEDTRVRASDMQVLSGAGIESEAELPFAALHQLVRPILGSVETLPRPQARALRAALGLEAGGGDDRFFVSLALLSLLAEAAERAPLLCLIDDAHWLDDASADALVFVARRLAAEGIVLLFATREGEARQFDAPALPELRLGVLDAEAARALLAGVALPPEARERLVEAAGGNPLALLELPRALSEAQLTGSEPLLAPLPVSARVERAFLGRVRGLPEQTQTLLLVAAAEDSGELSTVLRAAAQLGVGSDALDAAERAGLVHVRGGRFELQHPLVRSAVYQAAPLSQRQAAHRALASVLKGETESDRRAWHLAAASVEPDHAVVDELEQAAERARQRSAFAAASLAFERAAALTDGEQQRVRRLIAAGENAWFGGRPERARSLLERARPLASKPLERADIDRYLGLIELTAGAPGDACQILLRAATEVAPLDGERALQLLNFANVAAVFAGDGDASVAIADLARGLDVEETPFTRMLVEFLVGAGAHFEGDFERSATTLKSALALEEELAQDPAVQQPLALLYAGQAAIFLCDDQAVYRIHHATAARARATGAVSLLAQILPRLAVAELWAGRYPSASATAQEGLALAREIGQHDLVAYELVVLALIAACRGNEEECRSLAAEARELATAHRFTLIAEFARWALALLELGLGQAEDALRRAREISTTGADYWAALDRIEAAVRAGAREIARDWLAAFEPWAQSAPGLPGRSAVVSHCQALLSEDEHEAEGLFQAALDAHAEATRPFERARTELAFGEFLRRARRRLDAREYLGAALDGFETLGAELWAERARVELRASGQTARRRIPSTRDQLTAQELQIAQFVAQGLSNREVGAQLFLSPRTIAFHLRNVFRKLGISSRAQLAGLDLDAQDATGTQSADPANRPVRA
jgi:DNA-binding CsgD family transcriptional regulator